MGLIALVVATPTTAAAAPTTAAAARTAMEYKRMPHAVGFPDDPYQNVSVCSFPVCVAYPYKKGTEFTVSIYGQDKDTYYAGNIATTNMAGSGSFMCPRKQHPLGSYFNFTITN